jgi:Acetyltransferase (GNAT) domain
VANKLEEHAVKLARTHGEAGAEIRRQAPGAAGTPKVLMRLPLSGGPDKLMDSFPAKLRSQIRKPTREGLTAASGGEELLESFFKVFTKNMRDLGSPTHSLNWFREVIGGYGDRARVTVVSLPDGAACAAGITLVEGQRAFVPWASSLREHNRKNGNMLLYWSMLSQAADAGLAEFEFGRSTPGQGTYQFKKQWGASELGLAWTRHATADRGEQPVMAASGKQRLRPLAEACWRRLPLFLANWAGPRLRRYISL